MYINFSHHKHVWVQITQYFLVFQQCYQLQRFFFFSTLLLNVQNLDDVHFISFCIGKNFIKINIFKIFVLCIMNECHGNISLMHDHIHRLYIERRALE